MAKPPSIRGNSRFIRGNSRFSSFLDANGRKSPRIFANPVWMKEFCNPLYLILFTFYLPTFYREAI